MVGEHRTKAGRIEGKIHSSVFGNNRKSLPLIFGQNPDGHDRANAFNIKKKIERPEQIPHQVPSVQVIKSNLLVNQTILHTREKRVSINKVKITIPKTTPKKKEYLKAIKPDP